ncbi:MAG: DegT/DnrJ/EryC1/StrS family aminotransferase [Candidatus Zhuqueibacterota bacterium]
MATHIPFLDLKAQYQKIKHEVDEEIQKVVESCAFIKGPATHEFVKNFAAFCHVNHGVGVGNGTDAIFLALRALDIGPGHEVITSPNTFIATTEAISLTGARPVFVDIHPTTYNIDVSKIEEKITEKTRAIVAVHLFGQPADMSPILDIAKRHNLKVIEDSAQAHGATYKGRPVGCFGHVACFSFYPGKNLGAYGDGGAVLTNDENVARKVAMLADHGSSNKYEHVFEGVNSRLDTIQAAVLNVKLKYINEWNEQRRQNAYTYNKMLRDVPGVVIPSELKETKPVYHLYVIQVEQRDKMRELLAADGVATGIHYPTALHQQPAYAHLKNPEGSYPVAEAAVARYISLPMYPELTESMIDHVCTSIKKHVG